MKSMYSIIKYHYFNFFFILRCMFFSFLFSKKNGYLRNISPALKALRKKGFYKIDNYYSNEQVKYIKDLMHQALENSKSKNGTKIVTEILPGEIKIKNIQEEFDEIEKISNETFFVILSSIFNGKPSYPTILFDLVHDGSLGSDIVMGSSSERISGNYHYDDVKPVLKVLVLLDDLDESIGAQTCILPKSNKDSYLRNHFNGTKKRTEDEIDNRINNHYENINCFGKKGDLFILDTRNIHWGEKLIKGHRSVMWYYF